MLDGGLFLDDSGPNLDATATHQVTPVPSVRVLWRPEQFNRVTNGTFETDTTGWSVSAGINAAGTSVTRITTDKHTGSASASVVCTATDGSGVRYDMGSDRFYSEASYGAMYAAVVWLKRVSGSRRARIILGSEGTSSDRATLTITDLTDAWRPYVIRWLPTANRTDVQLAITNGSAAALTFRVDDVAVYLVDAFSQLENGTFETNTTGWAGYESGTIARSTVAPFGGDACARITASTTAYSGVYFTLASRAWVSGRTYRLRFAARSVSGDDEWYAEFYDGSTLDSTTFTAINAWRWVTLDWTAGEDHTTMEVGIYHPDASAAVIAIDEVEVYEAADDLGTDAGNLTWTRSLDGVGTIAVEVENADGRYDPRYASSPLYGSVAPGKRIWGRATYSGALYPLFHGTLTTIEAQPFGGITATLLAEDMMGDIGRAQHASRFHPDLTYAAARQRAIGAMLLRVPRNETAVGTSRTDLTTAGLEGSCFYAGTDDLVGVGDHLADLDQATQSVAHVAPSVHANIGWRYTTVDRITLTANRTDHTVDEDLAGLDSIRASHEMLENQQVIPWQSFEMGPLPPDHFWEDGIDLVATAQDRVEWESYGWLSDEDPYLHFTREAYGDNSDVPEPTYKETRRWHRVRGKNGRRKGRKLQTRRQRIFPDPFVPFTVGGGDVRVITVDLALPIDGLSAAVGYTAPDDPVVRFIERSPQRITFEVSASSTSTVSAVWITGTPYTPSDELEAQVSTGTDTLEGQYAGPVFNTPYIPSAGAAEGVANYRNWRYGTGLLAPQLTDHNVFPRTLTANLTDHLAVTATRWRLSAVPFVITGCRWEVSQGGLDWWAYHDLEELRTHDTWFTLGTSSLGGSDILAL